jgi:hypothetical protein
MAGSVTPSRMRREAVTTAVTNRSAFAIRGRIKFPQSRRKTVRKSSKTVRRTTQNGSEFGEFGAEFRENGSEFAEARTK